jgi:hypothetical protein
MFAVGEHYNFLCNLHSAQLARIRIIIRLVISYQQYLVQFFHLMVLNRLKIDLSDKRI